MTNALKVEFQNNALASQFKDKKVDIYGISFANNCIGLIEDKTSCMEGLLFMIIITIMIYMILKES